MASLDTVSKLFGMISPLALLLGLVVTVYLAKKSGKF